MDVCIEFIGSVAGVEIVWVNLGILSLRLVVIDCVDVEGNSRHAKLVS